MQEHWQTSSTRARLRVSVKLVAVQFVRIFSIYSFLRIFSIQFRQLTDASKNSDDEQQQRQILMNKPTKTQVARGDDEDDDRGCPHTENHWWFSSHFIPWNR